MSRTRGDGAARRFGESRHLDFEADQASLYAYSILAPSNNVEFTLGISYDIGG